MHVSCLQQWQHDSTSTYFLLRPFLQTVSKYMFLWLILKDKCNGNLLSNLSDIYIARSVLEK